MVLTGQATQKACPLTGKPVKSDAKVGLAAVHVAFCGNGCKTRVAKADAEKQLEICFHDKAFQKAFAVKKEKPEKDHQKEKQSK